MLAQASSNVNKLPVPFCRLVSRVSLTHFVPRINLAERPRVTGVVKGGNNSPRGLERQGRWEEKNKSSDVISVEIFRVTHGS